jgi:hypothetical protein
MALVLFQQNKVDEAEALCHATWLKQKQFLGVDCFETCRSRDNLIIIARRRRHWAIVEEVLGEQIKFLESDRGPYHCQTLDRRGFLGEILSSDQVNIKSKTAVSISRQKSTSRSLRQNKTYWMRYRECVRSKGPSS